MLRTTQNHRCLTGYSHILYNNAFLCLAGWQKIRFSSLVFRRLRGYKKPKPSVFTRIKASDKSFNSSPAWDRNLVFNYLGEINNVQSTIPSRMKCIFTLDVKIDRSLKVNRCTLVINSYVASSNSKGKIKKEWASFDRHSSRGWCLEAKVLETSKDVGGFKHYPTNGKFLEHYFPWRTHAWLCSRIRA